MEKDWKLKTFCLCFRYVVELVVMRMNLSVCG